MSDSISVVVHGASGRMGQACLGLLAEHPRLRLAAAAVSEGSRVPGQPVPRHPSLQYRELAEVNCGAIVVDFSGVAALPSLLSFCRERGLPLVSGTTGLGEREQALLDQAAVDIPLLWAANMSLGVQVLLRAARLAARLLPDYDLEILELHHRHKRDAPSGTALQLGEALAPLRSGQQATAGRFGSAALRVEGEIGYGVLRGGGVPGDHTVFLLGAEDRLELTHRAQDRALFARGALAAAQWLYGRPPGRYQLDDLFSESATNPTGDPLT